MRSTEKFNLNSDELRLFRRLSNPHKIQQYLDDLPYNKEPDGETCRSPREALRNGSAHCFEGALLAAAALRLQGRKPWILDLESVRDDDHVIAVLPINRCGDTVVRR